MIRIGRFRVYTGSRLWGWRMVGIGWGSLWFIGFSVNPPRARFPQEPPFRNPRGPEKD